MAQPKEINFKVHPKYWKNLSREELSYLGELNYYGLKLSEIKDIIHKLDLNKLLKNITIDSTEDFDFLFNYYYENIENLDNICSWEDRPQNLSPAATISFFNKAERPHEGLNNLVRRNIHLQKNNKLDLIKSLSKRKFIYVTVLEEIVSLYLTENKSTDELCDVIESIDDNSKAVRLFERVIFSLMDNFKNKYKTTDFKTRHTFNFQIESIKNNDILIKSLQMIQERIENKLLAGL